MKKLQKGDKIGIFTPSSPASVTAKVRYERGKAFLEEKGFQIIEGSLTSQSEGYRSGTPKARAEELNELLRDPTIKMIMSMIGGTNSNSILPYIDYDAFRENPKLVVGYSDATAILLALYAKTGIPTYYGPALVPSFGEFDPLVQETYRFFESYFCENPALLYEIRMSEFWSDKPVNWLEKTQEKPLYSNDWLGFNDGIVEGRLIGGNNNAMYGFIGTEYFPTIHEGDILLIEDSMKDASIVEKNIAMLKLHGVFDEIAAIILGKHECFDDLGTGKQPIDLLLEQLDGKNLPILAEFDTCHTHPMHPIAIGKNVRVDTKMRKVWCIEEWK